MGESEHILTTLMAQPMPRLTGERLCLDFANTVDPRDGTAGVDFLPNSTALIAWGRYTSSFTDAQAFALAHTSEQQPQAAEAAFAQAIELRETIYRIFDAVAHHQEAAPADLASLQQMYVTLLGHAQIAFNAEGYAWAWNEDDATLNFLLWRVVCSAIDLLIAKDIGRVKICASHGCGWLFFDTSKNGSRRWCSMEGCGSRDKMRRLYARKRAQ